MIPQSRFDPLAAKLIKQFWAPNNPGANITGVNNYTKGFIEKYGYYNLSERVDYNINDKWKVFGRLARYNTTDIRGNPTPNNSELYVPTGTARAAWNVGGDAIWTHQRAHGGGISRRLAQPARRLHFHSAPLRPVGDRSGRTMPGTSRIKRLPSARRSISRI